MRYSTERALCALRFFFSSEASIWFQNLLVNVMSSFLGLRAPLSQVWPLWSGVSVRYRERADARKAFFLFPFYSQSINQSIYHVFFICTSLFPEKNGQTGTRSNAVHENCEEQSSKKENWTKNQSWRFLIVKISDREDFWVRRRTKEIHTGHHEARQTHQILTELVWNKTWHRTKAKSQ